MCVVFIVIIILYDNHLQIWNTKFTFHIPYKMHMKSEKHLKMSLFKSICLLLTQEQVLKPSGAKVRIFHKNDVKMLWFVYFAGLGAHIFKGKGFNFLWHLCEYVQWNMQVYICVYQNESVLKRRCVKKLFQNYWIDCGNSTYTQYPVLRSVKLNTKLSKKPICIWFIKNLIT